MVSPLTLQTTLIAFGIILLTIQTPAWSSLPEGLGFLMVITGIIIPLIRQLQTDEIITINWQAIHWCALAILIYMIASLFWSSVPYDSLLIFKNYAIPFIIIICTGLHKRPILNVNLFIHIIAISGMLISAYSLLKLFEGQTVYPGLVNGPFNNPNSLAVYLGVSALIITHLLFQSTERKMRLLYSIALTIVLNALVLTHSKTAYITIFMSLIILIILSKKLLISNANKKFQRKSFIFALAAIPLFLIIINFEKIKNFNVKNITHIDTLASRFDIWLNSINGGLSTHPFLGNGIGTFKSIYPYFRSNLDDTSGLHAHNDFIHIFVELGLISLCFLFIFLFFIIRKIYYIFKQKKTTPTLALCIVVLLYCAISSMMTPVILLSSVMIIIGLCIAVLATQRKPAPLCKTTQHTPTKLAVVFLTLFSLVCIQNFLSEKAMSHVRHNLYTGDLKGFLKNIDIAETLSFGINPHVFILKTSALLTMDQQNLLNGAPKNSVLEEAEIYLSKAKKKNPYNTENLYYRALINIEKNKKTQAIETLQSILDITPEYIAARLKLYELSRHLPGAYETLKDGLNYPYWKADPTRLYKKIWEEAFKRGDIEAKKIVQKKLSDQLQLN